MSNQWRLVEGRTPRHALGVDVGRVVAAEDPSGISMLTDDWRHTQPVEGSVEALWRLGQTERFKESIYLVSKCGPKVQQRTREWMWSIKLFDRTGIPEHHLYFVRDYSEKAKICERLLVTHFADDRISNLVHMTTVSKRYLFSPTTPPQIPPWAIHVRSWALLEARLMRD